MKPTHPCPTGPKYLLKSLHSESPANTKLQNQIGLNAFNKKQQQIARNCFWTMGFCGFICAPRLDFNIWADQTHEAVFLDPRLQTPSVYKALATTNGSFSSGLVPAQLTLSITVQVVNSQDRIDSCSEPHILFLALLYFLPSAFCKSVCRQTEPLLEITKHRDKNKPQPGFLHLCVPFLYGLWGFT